MLTSSLKILFEKFLKRKFHHLEIQIKYLSKHEIHIFLYKNDLFDFLTNVLRTHINSILYINLLVIIN
jgi:hypothetical protein